MERLESETSYKRCRACGEIISDVSTDYTLPDYLGDIKRIVMTRETVSSGGACCEAGQILGGGVVTVSVIYVDAEGRLSSVEFCADYECSQRADTPSPTDVLVTSRIISSSVRATTPRRLVAKATVGSLVEIYTDEAITLSEELCSDKLEYKSEHVGVRSSYLTRLPEREYADRVCVLDGVMMDDVSIIAKSARPEINSIEPRDGALCIKGEIVVECAVMCAPLAPVMERVTIPFAEECEGRARDPLSFRAIPSIASLVTSITATDTGCEITCDLILDISVLEEASLPVSLPTDAYLPGSKTECVYDTVSFESIVGVIDEVHKSEARLDRAELGMRDVRDIILTDVTLRQDTPKRDGEDLILSGEIRYSGIATEITEGGSISYVGFKNSVHYAYNVNNCILNEDNVTYYITPNISGASCMIDKNNIVLSCEIGNRGIIAAKRSCNYIFSVSVSEGGAQERPRRITVYYPDKDESLYDVAKRFDKTCRAVANINSLGIDVAAAPAEKGGLKDVRRLIIY